MTKERSTGTLLDKVGICASGLCLIHCLATPLLVFVYPLFLHSEIHESLHIILALVVIASIMIAVFPKCHKHGHYDIIGISVIGMCFVLAGLFLHKYSVAFATLATSLGSVFLIWAHYKNMKVRHGKCSTDTHCNGHQH